MGSIKHKIKKLLLKNNSFISVISDKDFMFNSILNKKSNQFYYGNNSTELSPVAIGNIFNEDQLNGVATDGFHADQWDIYGTPGQTFSAGNINLNSALSGPPYFVNTIAYKHWYSCLEDFVWEAEVQINDIADYGMSFGLWYGGNTEYIYQMWLWGSGRMDMWSSANTYIAGVSLPPGSVTIANGDWLRVEMSRVADVLTISTTNITQSLPAVTNTLTWGFTYPFGFVTTQTFRPAIGNMGGSNNIRDFTFSTIDKKNIDALFITDSKGLYFPDAYADNFVNQLRTANPTKTIEISGAANETLTFAIANKTELALYNAAKVFIFRGCNDRRFGASQAQMETDLTTLKNDLTAAGATVYFVQSLPESGAGIDVTTVNAAGANVFAAGNIIGTYTPFWSGVGTGVNPVLVEADLIHPNLAGHNLLKSILEPYL